jgi:hypothetical protein
MVSMCFYGGNTEIQLNLRATDGWVLGVYVLYLKKKRSVRVHLRVFKIRHLFFELIACVTNFYKEIYPVYIPLKFICTWISKNYAGIDECRSFVCSYHLRPVPMSF